jgi:heme-degrading monooxygenase HmoA
MIARTWRGKATPDKAADYQHHFLTNVAPHIAAIPGHRGAQLLRHEVTGQVKFAAVTFWESMDSIKAFAGADPTVSVIEPEGWAALSSFDDHATHDEVVFMQHKLDATSRRV